MLGAWRAISERRAGGKKREKNPLPNLDPTRMMRMLFVLTRHDGLKAREAAVSAWHCGRSGEAQQRREVDQ